VWRKRADPDRPLDRVVESEEAGVVRRMARQLALNDVVHETLDAILP
jgi:hypothetical protein